MVKAYSVRAVIFDMDGVITNTMPDHFRAWKETLALAGINATHYDIYSREGQRGLTSLKEIFKQYHREIKPSLAKKLLNKKEEIFKGITKVRFISGARAFVKKLYSQQFALALVTGTSRHEVHRILPDYLYNLFDVIITGSDVKHGKPHPEPYLKALKALKLKAAEAIVIENAPFGILSAKNAGIRCVGIETSLAKEYLKKADVVVGSFKELQKTIKLVHK